MRSGRSIAWNHFKKSEDKCHGICNHCNASLAIKHGSSTGLLRHLRTKHRAEIGNESFNKVRIGSRKMVKKVVLLKTENDEIVEQGDSLSYVDNNELGSIVVDIDDERPISSPQNRSTSTATDVYRYFCPYCEMAFKKVVLYSLHMGYHNLENPFKCNVCGRATKDAVSFFLHVARSSHN